MGNTAQLRRRFYLIIGQELKSIDLKGECERCRDSVETLDGVLLTSFNTKVRYPCREIEELLHHCQEERPFAQPAESSRGPRDPSTLGLFQG